MLMLCVSVYVCVSELCVNHLCVSELCVSELCVVYERVVCE